jgi:large subunit ribosomal protein L22e
VTLGAALLSSLLSRLTPAIFYFQPKAAASKTPAVKHKFVIDYSKPAADGVFDGADFEKFLHDRIKVEGKAGQLGEHIKITRDGTFLRIQIEPERWITTFG